MKIFFVIVQMEIFIAQIFIVFGFLWGFSEENGEQYREEENL